MKRPVVVFLVALAMTTPAKASLVTMNTALGPIVVEQSFGARVAPLLNRLAASGLRAQVKCFAAKRGRHVVGSLHLSGRACDVLPLHRQAKGRNRMPTPAMMFTRKVAQMVADAGLRNGCSFRDCGHIDSGRSGSELMARRHHRHKRHRR